MARIETRTSFGYMPLYISDYAADTAHLSTLEHGAYLLLIMAYWRGRSALPASDFRLANIAHLSMDAWQVIKPTIAEFFIITETHWQHKRIEQELAKFFAKSENSRNARAIGIAKMRAERDALQQSLLPQKTSTDVQRTFNGRSTISGRSTDVPIKIHSENNNPHVFSKNLNGRSTDVQRTFNHADADAYIHTEESSKLAVFSKTETHTQSVRVRASDLNGLVSQRFNEFWNRYPLQVEKDAACAQWVSVVTTENEAAVFECFSRYLASDQVNRGVVKKAHLWLQSQHRDGWASKWPVAVNGKNGATLEKPKPTICPRCKKKPCECAPPPFDIEALKAAKKNASNR
jgi:uncharacterized protein YdaU (DUF1376 family)